MKKTMLMSVIFFLALVISGCQSVLWNNEVIVKLGGFPHGSEYYDVTVDLLQSDVIAKTEVYKGIPFDESFETSVLLVPCTTIRISLTPSNGDKPVYFWSFTVDSSEKVYSTIYWRTESSYVYTEAVAKVITGEMTEEINFEKVPFYLYKVPDARDRVIKFEITGVDCAINMVWGGSLQYIWQHTRKITGDETILFEKYFSSYYYVLITPDFANLAGTATLKISDDLPTSTKGTISDMVPSTRPDLVFAVDLDYDLLYYINPLTKSIEKEVSVPEPHPFGMVYSAVDNKLYFISIVSGYVIVYDVVIESFTKAQYSKLANGENIVLAPKLRKIFVISSEGIYILDMDTLQVTNHLPIGCTSLAVDETAKILYVGESYTGMDVTIHKYSLYDEDAVILETSTEKIPISCFEMFLSPDRTKLFISNSETLILNTTNLQEIISIPVPLRWGQFSLDGQVIYGLGSSGDIFVVDAETYSVIKKMRLPNASARMTLNSDGSILLASSIDSFGNGSIYYYSGVQK